MLRLLLNIDIIVMYNMKKIIFPILISLACLISCSEKGEAPVIENVVIDEATAETIVCHAEVTTGEITDCGIYYGITKNRVLNGTSDKIVGTCDGSSIRGEIKGLTPNKVYYIKVYGMNEYGISETDVIEVRTSSRTPSIDDNKYPESKS